MKKTDKLTGTSIVQLDDGILTGVFEFTAGQPSRSFYDQDDPDEIEFVEMSLETEFNTWQLESLTEQQEQLLIDNIDWSDLGGEYD